MSTAAFDIPREVACELHAEVLHEKEQLDASDLTPPIGGFYSRAVQRVATRHNINPYTLDRAIQALDDEDTAPAIDTDETPDVPSLLFGLSRYERDKAVELLRGEVALWSKLATMRLTTDAEAEVYRRHAYILERVAEGLSA